MQQESTAFGTSSNVQMTKTTRESGPDVLRARPTLPPSALRPFWKSQAPNDYWTSDACRDMAALNYTYADFATGETAAEVVLRLYGPDSVGPPPG